MKTAFVLLLAVAAVALADHNDDHHYTTKYDNIDLDEILSNERLYKKYFNCLRSTDKCTPDGEELKKAIPDALLNACKKCNPKQKDGAEKVIKFLLDKKPEDYEILEKIYDPEGTYKKQYEEEAKKVGIKV